MDEAVRPPAGETAFLAGGGDMARRIREHDWTATPLGPPERWPEPLRTLLGVIIGANQPMFVAWGPERILIYNDPYAEILARKHPAALGRPFLEVWHEIRDDLTPIVERAFEGQPVQMDDITLIMERRGHPEETHFAFSYTPVRDEAGAVVGFFCTCQEITGQVLAERQLRQSEARLRGVLDGMGEAFGLMDHDFRIITLNEAALQLEPRPLEEIVGRTHWEAYPGSEDSELGRLFKQALAERRPVGLEHQYTWGDGIARWLEMRAFPVSEGLAVFWRDISERKKGEAERMALAERNAETLESISDAFYAVDRDWRFTYVNRRAEHWWGRRREDLLGKVFQEEFPRALGTGAYQAHLRAAETREVVRLETVSPILHHWVDITIYPAADGGLSVYFRDISEKKRAEEELRESEARIRLMADAVPQIVWITDADGRIEFFNRQWAEYTGASGRPICAAEAAANFVHPDDAGPTMAAFEEARRTGGTFLIEHRIRSKTGEYRWFLVRAEPHRDPRSGEIVRWFGASVDIHDRREAEAALRALNVDLEWQVLERTRERGLIWELSLDLLSVIDLATGTFDTINPAWTAALGFTRDQVEGRSYEDFVHPEDIGASREAFGQLREGGALHGFVNRYRTSDGGWRWLSWAAVPEADKLYSVTRDVTAEIEQQARLETAEQARRQADALYRAYFENSPESLFVIGVTPQGGFIVEQLNPAHEAGVGYKLRDVRGRRIEEFLPQETSERLLSIYRRVAESGETYQFREVFQLNGEAQHWDSSLVPVRDEDGRVCRLIGSSRNVTRQVLAEEALRQAQKMEAVGQLTGGIAHDFNNLLGAVVGALDLIRRRPEDPDRVRRLAEAGLDAAERGAKLTGQLLAFSRAQKVELKPLVVAKLVQGLSDLLASTLGPMVRLTISAEEGWAVLSDRTQLEMAVLNLAINARDAMPEGGELTIGTRAHRSQGDSDLQAGDYVELFVSDTGSGMTPDVMARAFDPFYTTKGIGRGTGLGLSQVYGIARQAGGTARIESQSGAGTTVRIYLPRTLLPVEEGQEGQGAEDAAAPAAVTVLVVDDDLDMRRMLVASLESLGYRVIEARDGPAALEALDEAAPDLMMVDFAMPGMNGAELASAARARHPGLPIVFATGYADTAAIEAAAGEDAQVLRKPFRVLELQNVLARTSVARPG